MDGLLHRCISKQLTLILGEDVFSLLGYVLQELRNGTFSDEIPKLFNLSVKYCRNNGCNWSPLTTEKDQSFKDISLVSIKYSLSHRSTTLVCLVAEQALLYLPLI